MRNLHLEDETISGMQNSAHYHSILEKLEVDSEAQVKVIEEVADELDPANHLFYQQAKEVSESPSPLAPWERKIKGVGRALTNREPCLHNPCAVSDRPAIGKHVHRKLRRAADIVLAEPAQMAQVGSVTLDRGLPELTRPQQCSFTRVLLPASSRASSRSSAPVRAELRRAS